MPIGSNSPAALAPSRRTRGRRRAGPAPSTSRRGREADHVADGVDVRHGRPVVLVDRDAAAVVGREAGLLEVERVGRALRGRRRRRRRRRRSACRSRARSTVPPLVQLDADHLLAEAERDAELAQVVLQRLDDLVVAEVEQPGALLDDGHLGAERGEHRRVLDADHAGADDDERRRDLARGRGCRRSRAPCARRTRRRRGAPGTVPTAITIELGGQRRARSPSDVATATVCGSTKRAVAVHDLRRGCGSAGRGPPRSRGSITCCVRWSRSSIVISSLTR